MLAVCEWMWWGNDVVGVLVEEDLLPSIVKLVTIAPAVAGQSARQVRAMARAQ